MRNFRQLLSFLAGELAQSHGEKFFAQLCEALGTYLNADGVFVAERVVHEGKLHARTLALWHRGQQLPQVLYAMENTPTAQSHPACTCIHRHGVRERYPDAPDVVRFDIHSWVGIAFADSAGRTIGHICLFDSRDRLFPEDEVAAIRIAAVRAGAELHRIYYERSLQENERALAHSEQSLRILLEQSPVPMLVSNSLGDVELVNQEFQRRYGYGLRDMPNLETWWRRAFPNTVACSRIRGQWWQRLQQSIRLDPASQPIQAELTCLDGSTRFVEIDTVNIGDRIAATVHDLTEQHKALRAAEEARKQAEHASRAKDQFLAALSHELRTPLTPVLLASSHLQGRQDLPSEVAAEISVIRRNVEMEARLIDDLLDLARFTNGKFEIHRKPMDLHDAINATLEICWSDIETRQLRVERHLDAHQTTVRGDAARLQQVFWNLLKNAVKFSQPGGLIQIRSFNAHGQIIVEVADTGVGMTQEVISGLFTAFRQGSREVTRQFGGLGLGLSITRAIVDAHRGTIGGASDGPGRGSTFRLAFDTCPAPAPPRRRLPKPEKPSVHAIARILLVEDHQSTGQILKQLLERIGHEIVWAQTCAEARSVLAGDDQFDLLLSDLGLPDGSGLELMPAFRTRTGRPGIALSGFGMDHDIAQTRRAGFAMHLIKPIDVHRLTDAIAGLAHTNTMDSATDLPRCAP